MDKINKVFFAALICLGTMAAPCASADPAAPVEGRYYEVYRLIDGDTFVLRNEERVRLLGVDAPEVINSPKLHRDARQLGVSSSMIRSMGLQSKRDLSQLIQGKKVRLEYDGAQRDRNGRLLAYVYLEDGTWINAEVLRRGDAALLEKAKTGGLKRYEQLYQMQNEAIAQNRGVWRFMNDRISQLYDDPYSTLTPAQRKAVLEYIEQLRSGEARESYTAAKMTSEFKTSSESSEQKTNFPKPQPV